ncbi:hypothetical protein AB0L68_06520 [Streptomyces sp. NPDC052164]
MLPLEAEKRLDLDGTVESWLPGVVRPGQRGQGRAPLSLVQAS